MIIRQYSNKTLAERVWMIFKSHKYGDFDFKRTKNG